MADDRLEAALHDLAPRIAFPPTPAMRVSVVDRLHAPVARPVRWRPALLAAVIATLLVAAVASAYALGLLGLRIELTDTLPSHSVGSSLATRLALGERVTLDEAGDRSTIGVHVPRLLGEPDEAYVTADGEIVSLVYAAGADLPALAVSEIGLLVMQIDGSVDGERIEKLVLEVGSTVTPLSVDGAPGYWIEGRPHVMRYDDPGGNEGRIASRLVGDVLVWQRGAVLYRIESGLGLDATLEIATSMAER